MSNIVTPKEQPKISFPDLAMALSILALGGVLLAATLKIPFGINAYVGPRVFPLIVSTGITLLGALLSIAAFRGDRAEPAAEEDTDPDAPVNIKAVALILGCFLIGAFLLPSAGFVIGTAIMYFGVAVAFNERRYGLVIIVSLVVALITYVAFTRGLAIPLPAGILKGIL